MGIRDPRVDAYIDKAEGFAKPILTYLRETIHAACPGVEEDIKWSFPHFNYKGMFCSMASFKRHCAFGFWNSAKVLGGERNAEAMGSFGRITAIADLPPKRRLVACIRRAKALKDAGVTLTRPKRPARPAPRTPTDLAAALKENAKARATYRTFSPSHKREYVEWITEAKTESTRSRRIREALTMMAQGKPRNWKYLSR